MCFAGVGAILPPAGNIAPFRFIPVPLYINGGALMSKPLTATQSNVDSSDDFQDTTADGSAKSDRFQTIP